MTKIDDTQYALLCGLAFLGLSVVGGWLLAALKPIYNEAKINKNFIGLLSVVIALGSLLLAVRNASLSGDVSALKMRVEQLEKAAHTAAPTP